MRGLACARRFAAACPGVSGRLLWGQAVPGRNVTKTRLYLYDLATQQSAVQDDYCQGCDLASRALQRPRHLHRCDSIHASSARSLPPVPRSHLLRWHILQHLRVCAAYVPGRREESPSESGLPVRPLPQPGAPNQRLFIWSVPFLRCLRETLHDKSLPGTYDAVMDALVYFCWALQEPCIPTKLALLAMVPRTLLRATSGVTLSDAEAFDPRQIGTALERLAAQRRLRLPADAVAALTLSHRLALYGEGGARSRAGRSQFLVLWTVGSQHRNPPHTRGDASGGHDPLLRAGGGSPASGPCVFERA
jgi:hypothetical protein